jgi:hypothetical protein
MIISIQIIPSVGIFPLVCTESYKKLLMARISGLLLEATGALASRKINCKKGMTIPMETIEKMILRRVKRK